MDREQRIAYINTQAVCAQAEIAGMIAENDTCKMQNRYPRYGYKEFTNLCHNFTISHNEVIAYLQD